MIIEENEGIAEQGYSNSCISEYISCNIIESIGLKVQKTLLGIYRLKEIKKIEIAPIYDCASCLYPQLTDEKIEV